MVTGTVAELLVAVTLDPAHGFLLTLGAGGITAELMADVEHLALPCSRDAVNSALNRLKLAPLLDGYRGAPGADRPAILDAVMVVIGYVGTHRDHLIELEINPLICTADAAVAVDALLRQATPEDQT